MSEHRATVAWHRGGSGFAYASYDRGHRWIFDDGVEVPARAAPENLPPTAPRAPGVDPEQAFVAALSSCHMLWFLHLATRAQWTVDDYVDDAVGVLEQNEAGKMAVTRVTLRPKVVFAGTQPGADQVHALHEQAHERCFIAHSVRSEVRIEPQP